MINPDDYLEMAMTRYAEILAQAQIERPSARGRPRSSSPRPRLRAGIAGLLRGLADVIYSESGVRSADGLLLSR